MITQLKNVRLHSNWYGRYTEPGQFTSKDAKRFTLPKSLASSTSAFTRCVRSATLTFSDWIIEWTPFLLVASYYIVTTAIFCMCSEPAIKVFYFFYMVSNFYISVCCVIESFLGLTPVRDARRAAAEVEKNDGRFPSDISNRVDELPIIDIVIVAYLPNEKDIVRNQVLYALEELIYPPEKLRINLVYNTPTPIEPLESELALLPEQYKNLKVIKVPGSKSKADNLNYFFEVPSNADVIGIFDTDHTLHPHNPRWAAERFLSDANIDIVQGRCVIYNTDNFLTRMIGVEFDKIYALSHPGRQRMFGFGLFCGSNGYWKADLLRGHKMDGDMLTEDIDSALRAYAKGKNAVHDINVASFEMAPTTFGGFWKQRMRWTQGWTQASIRHLPLAWTNPPNDKKRNFDERFGLISLLLVREISYYLVSQNTCLLLSFIIIDWPHNPAQLAKMILFRYPMAEWFFFSTVTALLFTLFFTQKVRSEFTTWRSMLTFCTVYIPYLVIMATMGLYGHARQIVRYSRWNPTARK